MNGLEHFLTIMDKYGVSLVIIGVFLFLLIKYTPKIIETYREYVKTMQKISDTIENLSDDLISLDLSVNDLRETMKRVGTAVNHNSDNLVKIIEQVAFIKGKLNGDKNE